MDENRKKDLQAAGIDVDEALERFMNNEALLMKFLLRFPEDQNFCRLRQAMDQSDVAGAFEAAHTLKGVAGNLSLRELFIRISVLVEDLRAGNLEAAAEKMPCTEQAYDRILRTLEQMNGSSDRNG